MEDIKIENFYRENPQGKFPLYMKLDEKNCTEIRKSIARKLGLVTSANDLELVNAVDSSGETYGGMNPNDESFNLSAALCSMKVECSENVFVNWYRYDNIDKFNLLDLTRYFDDIWYPELDDVDIFDESFTWIVSITHSGKITFVKF